MKTYHDIRSLRSALSACLKIQNISQLDVSRKTGIQQSAISMFLSGKRGLNGDSALKIQSFILKASELAPCPSPADGSEEEAEPAERPGDRP